MTGSRPHLDEGLTGTELQRWYWLHRELVGFARTLGVPTGGGKQVVIGRLVAHLDGRPLPAPPPRGGRAAPALAEPLTPATVIPAGQRCTQQLRRYLTEAVGPSFTFDARMRDFVAGGAGRTLGDAVVHWHSTRRLPAPEIGRQFELNAFLRRWYEEHPGGTRDEALDAWWAHRSLPVEARRPPTGPASDLRPAAVPTGCG